MCLRRNLELQNFELRTQNLPPLQPEPIASNDPRRVARLRARGTGRGEYGARRTRTTRGGRRAAHVSSRARPRREKGAAGSGARALRRWPRDRERTRRRDRRGDGRPRAGADARHPRARARRAGGDGEQDARRASRSRIARAGPPSKDDVRVRCGGARGRAIPRLAVAAAAGVDHRADRRRHQRDVALHPHGDGTGRGVSGRAGGGRVARIRRARQFRRYQRP